MDLVLDAAVQGDLFGTTQVGEDAQHRHLHAVTVAFLAQVLDRAQATSSDVALVEAYERNGLYPGFGHTLYERGDPRARVLLDLLHEAWPGNRRMAQVDALITAARRRGELPNVDVALAALAYVAGMAPDAGEAVFTIARTAGWLAHAFEEYDEPVLRFRPRAQYREP